MTKRGWILFSLVGILWGIPYLFMKVAVRDFTPATVVCGRTLIGALMLIPFAIHQGSLRDALRGIKYVIPYAIMEMIGPWILITNAEKEISSGLAGLLIATVPIWATLLVALEGDRSVLHHKRLVGIIVGFVGVVALVGIESLTGSSNPKAILMVVAAAMSYSYAVMTVVKKLPGVSGIAINGVAMAVTSIFYFPFAARSWPDSFHINGLLSIIALGIFSTGIAFVLFFTVLDEIGPARASLVTYLNTAFAVVLGVILLNEPFTVGIAIGLPMVLIGSYLAGKKPAEVI